RHDAAPEAVLRSVLDAMIPSDDAGMRRLRVMAQFETLSLTKASIAKQLRDGHAQLRALLTKLIGYEKPDLDEAEAASIAQRLLAVGEGLSGQVLLGHESCVRARELLQLAVDASLAERSADAPLQ